MVKFTFRGLMAPVFTPFNNDSYKSLNLKIIPDYAEYLLKSGIQGVLVNGTSGEGMSMDVNERKLCAEDWVNACKNTKQTLMVQVGGAPLPDVLELARHAESLKVDALLCLPELYIKPNSSEMLIDYLLTVSKAAPNTPLLYYHIPAFTNVNVYMPDFLAKANNLIPNLVGIKFTSTDLIEGAECLQVCAGKYVIFLGADQIMCAAYTLGFNSAIATTLNMFPVEGQQILQTFQYVSPILEEATKAQNFLNKHINCITKHGSWVATMKATMNIITPLDLGPVREPMVELTAIQKGQIQSAINDLYPC